MLSDLKDCKIMVGGGFPVANLDPLNWVPEGDPLFQGWLYDPVDDDFEGRPAEDAVGVRFCFCPYSTWLSIWIRGWPREEWEAKIEEDDVDAGDIIDFLVENVASQYPGATVEFKEVSFVARHILPALKRLLSPRRRAEVQVDRDARNEAADEAAVPQWTELRDFVVRTMREGGNAAGPELFMPQVEEVMGTLHRMGITSRAQSEERDAIIVQMVTWYEQFGVDAMRVVIDQALN